MRYGIDFARVTREEGVHYRCREVLGLAAENWHTLVTRINLDGTPAKGVPHMVHDGELYPWVDGNMSSYDDRAYLVGFSRSGKPDVSRQRPAGPAVDLLVPVLHLHANGTRIEWKDLDDSLESRLLPWRGFGTRKRNAELYPEWVELYAEVYG